MTNKITFDFSQPLLNHFNEELKEQSPQLIDNIIKSLNVLINHDGTIYNYTPENMNRWHQQYDTLLKPLIEDVKTINNESIIITKALMILINIVLLSENSTSAIEISLIGKLRVFLNLDPATVELTLQEAILLKKLITDSKMKTIYKEQLLQDFIDIK